MNLRTPIAEQPFSCAVLHEEDASKVLFGSLQIKTFIHKLSENIDEVINKFLSEKPIYVVQIAQYGAGTDQVSIRITYREITKLPIRKEKLEMTQEQKEQWGITDAYLRSKMQ